MLGFEAHDVTGSPKAFGPLVVLKMEAALRHEGTQ